MGCRIYLVRHGETEWNASLKYQGQTDVPLSGKGRQQADLLGKRLDALEIEGFYSSNLIRAYDTAMIISQHHNQEIVKLPELKELNFGLWEGMNFNEIKSKYPEEINMLWEKPLHTRVPGGETIDEMIKRTVKAVKTIVKSHNKGNIVLVSHGGVIRSIVGTVLGMDMNNYWRLRLDNACLNIIDFPELDKGILMLFNDLSHLESAAASRLCAK
jgi:alpha-ribazole phosphatase/probable phosphoglycerate mutase